MTHKNYYRKFRQQEFPSRVWQTFYCQFLLTSFVTVTGIPTSANKRPKYFAFTIFSQSTNSNHYNSNLCFTRQIWCFPTKIVLFVIFTKKFPSFFCRKPFFEKTIVTQITMFLFIKSGISHQKHDFCGLYSKATILQAFPDFLYKFSMGTVRGIS